MNVCRICLSEAVEKDVNQLPEELIGNKENYSEIMLFCLNIKVSPASKLTTKLCKQCYVNIVSFYKFKTLALENDVFLQRLQRQENDKCESSEKDHIKSEKINNGPNNLNDMNEFEQIESQSKNEQNREEIRSEYVLFNEIQEIKFKYIHEAEDDDDWCRDSISRQRPQADPQDDQFTASTRGDAVFVEETLNLQEPDTEEYTFIEVEEPPLSCYRIHNKSNKKSLNGYVRGFCVLLGIDKTC